jgi:hypothetical protein
MVTDSGQTWLVAALDPTGRPNGITVDPDGNICTGDSPLGADGSAGPAREFPADPRLVGADDIDSTYAATSAQPPTTWATRWFG